MKNILGILYLVSISLTVLLISSLDDFQIKLILNGICLSFAFGLWYVDSKI